MYIKCTHISRNVVLVYITCYYDILHVFVFALHIHNLYFTERLHLRKSGYTQHKTKVGYIRDGVSVRCYVINVLVTDTTYFVEHPVCNLQVHCIPTGCVTFP